MRCCAATALPFRTPAPDSVSFAFAAPRRYDRRSNRQIRAVIALQGSCTPLRKHVVVIGGGVMGSALAYWLTRLESSVSATVVERDPSYRQASSALSAASIRQQFSTPVNIRASQASIPFLRNAAVELAGGARGPGIMCTPGRYRSLPVARR